MHADFSKITIPTLVFAAEADRIAPVDKHAWLHYQTLPKTTAKAFIEFAGGNHFFGNSPAERMSSNIDVHDLMGRFAIAWLKFYVDNDERYRPFIYGELAESNKAKLSRFLLDEGK